MTGISDIGARGSCLAPARMAPRPGAARRPTRWRLPLVLAVLSLALPCASGAPAAPGTAAELADAERLLDRLEAGEPPGRPLESLPQWVDSLIVATEAHLRRTPSDADAHVVAARLLGLRALLHPARDRPRDPTPADPLDAALEHLEHAATLRPDDARMDYWRARLLGAEVPRWQAGRWVSAPRDLAAAIEAAARATARDPTQPAYRETWASLLAAANRLQEALQVLDSTAPQDSPSGATPEAWDDLRALLGDLLAVPLPPGTVFLETDSRELAQREWSRGRFRDYPRMRVRVYAIPAPAADIEAFLQRTWPEFRFLEPRSGGRPMSPDRRRWVQMLLLGGGPPRPVTDRRQLDVARMDGITLTLFERPGSPERPAPVVSPAGEALPEVFRATHCLLYIFNDRTLHW